MIQEQTYYQAKGGSILRPFLLSSGVDQRGYSTPLQRRITDFGADVPFGKVNDKLQEHYGITVSDSSLRTITLNHAHEIKVSEDEQLGKVKAPEKACIISETDGSMIPIVQPQVVVEGDLDKVAVQSEEEARDPAEEAKVSQGASCFGERKDGHSLNEEKVRIDRRKGKTLCYKEAKLTLAYEKGSVTPKFSATMAGAEVAGKHVLHCVQLIGVGKNTKVHGVGDGAPWIANRMEEQFGNKVVYLIDFYHLCEYLSAAAPLCATKDEEVRWLDKQKARLKQSKAFEVLLALQPHVEGQDIVEEKAPVRACYRYIKNRLHQLDYKTAIDEGLPIGSGEIESAHRYVIQKRLKIAGAWWREENAGDMLALRTNRANGQWGDYWKQRKTA